MRVHTLGPHTFISEQPHVRHHEWLTSFSPAQRRQLVEEDIEARTAVVGIIAGALAFGIFVAVIAYLVGL